LDLKKTDFPLSKNKPTILFLGDSFTEGLYVEPGLTFSNVFGILAENEEIDLSIVNSGISGYGSMEESWIMENYHDKFQTKLAVLSIYPNDVGSKTWRAYEKNQQTEIAYENLLNNLNIMNQFASQKGFLLVISMIPAKDQFLGKASMDFQKIIGNWCKEFNLYCLNPFDYFQVHGVEKIYFSWDNHFSPYGHFVYADYLFNNLKDKLQKLH
jgi:lysophospholipase L1-like esterase